ncbi:CRISPR-associated protein, Cmr4 family [Bernardetia litoralis DSM 6794]|uniref:CRISPR-associated protein, Cmr4 family n=1 Tax=Bernardetia litoralis (strain ATCC 23117 / DSM 6794 / NBRC 15988 / NCIMB 1366 / Fx l1 / Sio-4) TaxID=880071 RepID=I4AP48_BERLS|nr:type III-B CRISPR module RAMP protein Cmr4 [Bernardetia litoralis]AFM05733.1 CRISPR-associated protein, Cmr4 family [Bernardetia litoralis DSM 6794]
MYQKANPLFLICETQLHAGSGDDLGIVDLPIQRERHTSFPKIEASSFKGAVREALENPKKNLILLQNDQNNFDETKYEEYQTKIHRIFGYDEKSDKGTKAFKGENKLNPDFAGCISFSDARLLLFPVKSMKGVFAWITCPRVLQQFEKDMKLTEGNENFEITNIPDQIEDGEAYLIGNSTNTKIGTSNIVLEEYAFEIKNPPLGTIGDKSLGEWISVNLFNEQPLWKEKVKKDILVLSNNDFKDFVNLSTEVITRTKIDNYTGTVATGQLFTEEYLPSESILYTLVLTAPELTKATSKLSVEEVESFFETSINSQEIIQVGGNSTLGKGLIRTKFLTQTKKGELNEQ